MNERSFIVGGLVNALVTNPLIPPLESRRQQILAAAQTCFARKGFHQTTMQDISQTAGISVGLIYRYFQNKEQVIATLATEHMREIQLKFDLARQQPNLFEALDGVLWCDQTGRDEDLHSSFVVDLFAESSRNPQVHALVAQVHVAMIRGVTDLIASSSFARDLAAGVTPAQAAEMVFHTIHGLMFDEIVDNHARTKSETRDRRAATLHQLWSLLFPTLTLPPSSVTANHDAS